MNLRHAALLVLVACSISGCDESVRLNYATRAEAEAESHFARGWLPKIIPPSSRNISMLNDLDLNTSTGEFSFDPSENSVFVSQLERMPSRDEGGSLAYAYKNWIFWITGEGNQARFSMQFTQDKPPSESGRGGRITPATTPTPPGMRVRTGRFQSDSLGD